MNYAEIIKKGLVLPFKNKYTKRDVDNLISASLFDSKKTLSVKEAVWIVLCSAACHGSEWSKTITKMRSDSTKEVQL